MFTCRPLSGDPSSMYCLKVLLILLERVSLFVLDKWGDRFLPFDFLILAWNFSFSAETAPAEEMRHEQEDVLMAEDEEQATLTIEEAMPEAKGDSSD